MRVLGLDRIGELVTMTVIKLSTPADSSAVALTSAPSAVYTGSNEQHTFFPLLKK